MNKRTQEQPMITVPVEYISSPEFHIPTLSNELGKKAVGKLIDVVSGIQRTASAESEDKPEITSVADPRRVPGTSAYEQEQIRISNIARSEWAASNAHNRE